MNVWWKPLETIFVRDLRQLLLVLPTELVEVADVADRLGPAPREEALDVVPVGLGQDSTGNIKPQFSMLFLLKFQTSHLKPSSFFSC